MEGKGGLAAIMLRIYAFGDILGERKKKGQGGGGGGVCKSKVREKKKKKRRAVKESLR